MTKLTLKNIIKRYDGNDSDTVKNLNLTVERGEIVALLGPSGCGKTSMLKIIAGLENVTSGEVLFDNEDVTKLRPEKRGVSMVFQKALLFPHMSVFDNVAFGLKMRGVHKTIIKEKVFDILKLVKMEEFAKRSVKGLSGGQEQRIALARGLIVEPKLLLLDEPLSALDAKLRYEMQDFIRYVQRKCEVTTVFVTHDQEEAVMLSDKIAFMLDGKLEQFDTPQAFYYTPKTLRVAEFFGCRNFLDCKQKGNTVKTKLGTFVIKNLPHEDRDALLVLRGECFESSNESDALQSKVLERTFLGSKVRYKVIIDGDVYFATLDGDLVHEIGEIMGLKVCENKLWVVSKD